MNNSIDPLHPIPAPTPSPCMVILPVIGRQGFMLQPHADRHSWLLALLPVTGQHEPRALAERDGRLQRVTLSTKHNQPRLTLFWPGGRGVGGRVQIHSRPRVQEFSGGNPIVSLNETCTRFACLSSGSMCVCVCLCLWCWKKGFCFFIQLTSNNKHRVRQL